MREPTFSNEIGRINKQMDSLETKLVSAKDLIDFCIFWINEYEQSFSPLDKAKIVELNNVIGQVVGMPHEEPEMDEWCTDCKEYDSEKHNCPRFNKVIRKTVEEIRRENEWTPCSKELPKEDGDYLVTLEKGFAEDYGSELVIIMNFEVDCESFGYWYESFDPHTLGSLGSDWREIPVTAWKRLSEPWEGEQDETD